MKITQLLAYGLDFRQRPKTKQIAAHVLALSVHVLEVGANVVRHGNLIPLLKLCNGESRHTRTGSTLIFSPILSEFKP